MHTPNQQYTVHTPKLMATVLNLLCSHHFYPALELNLADRGNYFLVAILFKLMILVKVRYFISVTRKLKHGVQEHNTSFQYYTNIYFDNAFLSQEYTNIDLAYTYLCHCIQHAKTVYYCSYCLINLLLKTFAC